MSSLITMVVVVSKNSVSFSKLILLNLHFTAKHTAISDKDEQFNKLSPKSQAVAKQISQMGFNRELVIRVLNRIGEDDKNIVEHLISLSELLQMGFDENLVSEALVKFDNNKDRALDFLIS
jgi:uncharacterized UBP type Zn finger protein